MKRRAGLAALLASPAVTAARAGKPAGTVEDGPFVEHRVVLQLSDRDAARQALVLSVSFNLLSAYGPDKVAIEVVAFGPGIVLLRQGNPNGKLIDSLVAQGVRFAICMNTVETEARKGGARFPINPKARRVAMGVPRMLELAEAGYTPIRP